MHKRRIREDFLRLFQDHDCYSLSKPTNNEILLKKLYLHLNDYEFNQEFLIQIKTFKELLLHKIKPKQFKGINLTARMYIHALEKYLESINNHGYILSISNILEYVIDKECKIAYDFAINLYEYALNKLFFNNNENQPKTMNEIYHILKNIRDKSLEKYYILTKFINKHECFTMYQEKLKEHIGRKESTAIMINEEVALIANEKYLKTLSRAIKSNLDKGAYDADNFEMFCDDFTKMAIQYDEDAKGFQPCNTFIKFLKPFNREALKNILNIAKKNNNNTSSHYSQPPTPSYSIDGVSKSQISSAQKEIQKAIKAYREKESLFEEKVAKAMKEKEEAILKVKEYEKEIIKFLQDDYERKLDLTKDRLIKSEEKLNEERAKYEAEIKEIQEELNKPKKNCCIVF